MPDEDEKLVPWTESERNIHMDVISEDKNEQMLESDDDDDED